MRFAGDDLLKRIDDTLAVIWVEVLGNLLANSPF
jgi:hypothetical protein